MFGVAWRLGGDSWGRRGVSTLQVTKLGPLLTHRHGGQALLALIRIPYIQ